MGWNQTTKKPTDLKTCANCSHPVAMISQSFLSKKIPIHVSRLRWDMLREMNHDTGWQTYKMTFLMLILKDKKEAICGYNGCKCNKAEI